MFQKGGTEKGKRMRLEVSCKTYVAYKIKAKSVPIPRDFFKMDRKAQAKKLNFFA